MGEVKLTTDEMRMLEMFLWFDPITVEDKEKIENILRRCNYLVDPLMEEK